MLIEGGFEQHTQSGFQVRGIGADELQTNEGISFTDLLSRKVPGGVRSYGISGLTTANLRGTGSSHTGVIWNGISLESPSTGQVDLSQVSGGVLDEVAIQFGGSSGAFGSGAIGGTIHLINRPEPLIGTRISTNHLAGSFGRLYQRYKVEKGSGKHHLGLSWFRETADNDFKFRNTSRIGAPEERWEHAGVLRSGILAEYNYKPLDGDQLKFVWWHQNNELEIPNPLTVNTIGESTQDDLFDRILISYSRSRTISSWEFTSALINNQLDYEDPSVDLVSDIDFSNWHNQIRYKGYYDFANVKVDLSHRYERVTSSGFSGGDTFDRQRVSSSVNLKKNFGAGTTMTLGIQQEFVGSIIAPIIPSMIVTRGIGPSLVLRGNASRVYRVPTFNDLFWNGAGAEGNPDLKPEEGWTWEFGGDWTFLPEDDLSMISVSVFSSHIQNWILWAPNSFAIWSPNNLKSVWSRGLQLESNWVIRNEENWKIDAFGNYQLTYSTNKAVTSAGNQSEVDRQLIYTPRHQGGLGLSMSHKTIEWKYLINYVGKQYTTGDNNPFLTLDPYLLSNVQMIYNGSFSKVEGSLRLELNNIFNTTYQVRSGYPMPGFHFNIGLNLKFSYP